jgi:hypothetical protein
MATFLKKAAGELIAISRHAMKNGRATMANTQTAKNNAMEGNANKFPKMKVIVMMVDGKLQLI